MKRKAGEVRADGFIFREYRKLPSGSIVEHWMSPESAARKRKRQREWTKEWLTNPENRAKYNERAAVYACKLRRQNPISYMLSRAKIRAKKHGLAFDLTSRDVHIPECCPVLGIKLRVATGLADDASPELDRIVPSRGYVSGNILVISRRANRIKNDATPEELQVIASFYLKLVGS